MIDSAFFTTVCTFFGNRHQNESDASASPQSEVSRPSIADLHSNSDPNDGVYAPAFYRLRLAIRQCFLWCASGPSGQCGEMSIKFTSWPRSISAPDSTEAAFQYGLVFQDLPWLSDNLTETRYYPSPVQSQLAFEGSDEQSDVLLVEADTESCERYDYKWTPNVSQAIAYAEKVRVGAINTIRDYPGIDLSSAPGGIGIIVKTLDEARMVMSDILTLIDSEQITADLFKFVIPTDALHLDENTDFRSALYEVLPLHRVAVPGMPPRDEELDNDDHYNHCCSEKSSDEARQLLMELEAQNPLSDLICEVLAMFPADQDQEVGAPLLWFLDNMHPLTRYMVSRELVSVTPEGKYVAWVSEFAKGYSLSQKRDMLALLAAKTQETYGVTCGYVVGQDTWSTSPLHFAVSDHLWSGYYYNIGFKREDAAFTDHDSEGNV